MRYPTVTALLYVYALLLLPLFQHLWLHAGSGNANFFYAVTLVWALAGTSSLLDALWAWGRLAWERERQPLRQEEEEAEDSSATGEADTKQTHAAPRPQRHRVVVQA